MKKFSIFALFSMLCNVCFGAASIRASSISMGHPSGIIQPKATIATTVANTDLGIDKSDTSVSAKTNDTDAVNTSRISFASPLGKTSGKYYIPTNTNSSGNNSSANNTANTAKEMAELQKQIDDLLAKQTQMENTLPRTVQQEIKNSDLTKNATFNDAISDLQETVASDSMINEKINESLVSKGIVDNRGNLLVATSDEIQPLALSQKLESTLAVKFAKKADVTPSKIANEIVSDNVALQTLSNKVGTNEDSVKDLIVSDLRKRGIVDSNNALRVATKDELPVINADTVSQALQNTTEFDNMVSQNLVRKGIYDSNNQLQVIKKAELTPEFLSTKLDDTYAKSNEVATINNKVSVLQDGDENTTGSIAYKLKHSGFVTNSEVSTDALSRKLDSVFAKTGDITPAKLSDKLSTVFVTPSEMANANKNFVEKSDVTADAIASKLVTSTSALNTLSEKIGTNENDVKRLLKEKLILNDNDTLNVATKEEVSAENLKATLGDTYTKRTDLSGLITADLKSKEILKSDGTLNVETPTIDETTISSVLAKSETLGNMIDTAVSNKGYLTSNSDTIKNLATKDEISAENLTNKLNSTFATKEAISAESLKTTLGDTYTKKTDLSGLITADLKSKEILKSDGTLNVETPTIDETTVTNALARSETLGNMIDTAVSNKGYLTSSDINNLATKTDLSAENLGKTLDSRYASASSVSAENLASALDKTFTKPSDIFDTNGVLKSDKIPSNLVTASGLSQTLGGYATTSDISAESLKTTLGDTYTKKTDLSGLITADLKSKEILKSDGTLNVETPTIDETTVTNALARSETLGNMIDTAVSNKGYLTSSDISTLATKSDLTADKLGATLDGRYASASSVTPANLVSALDGTFAKSTDIFDNNGVLKTTRIPSNLVTSSSLNETLNGYATTGSISGFLTDDDLTQSKLVGKLGTAYLTDSDLTQSKLVGKLGSAYLTDSDLTATSLANKLGKTYTKSADVNSLIAAGLTNRGIISVTDGTETLNVLTPETLGSELTKNNVVTDSALTTRLGSYATTASLSAAELGKTLDSRYASASSVSAENLASTLNGTFAKPSDIFDDGGTLKTSKLPASVITTGNIATSLPEDVVTSVNIAQKLPATVITTGNLGTSGIITTSNIATNLPNTVITTTNIGNNLPNTVMTTDNVASTLKGTLGGTSSNNISYSQALTLEDAIKAIAADVAADVSKQISKQVSEKVSKHISKEVSTNVSKLVSDQVAKKRINDISGSLVTPSSLQNFVTNGIEISNSGAVIKSQNCNDQQCMVNPAVSGLTATNKFSNFSYSSLGSDVTSVVTDSVTNGVSATNVNIDDVTYTMPSSITFMNACSTNQYLDTTTNTCTACPSGTYSNGGSVTSCSCNVGYYKSGNSCLPCGSGATSTGDNVTSCTCNNAYMKWTSGTNGGSCSQDQTTCLATEDMYWNNGSCTALPANSARSADGLSFSCLTNYYKSGNSCLTCGTDAVSGGGYATSCSCNNTLLKWVSGTNGGSCNEDQTTCLASDSMYWANGSSCKKLPGNSTRTSAGTGFNCNANYYKSGDKCFTCGSGATSESGSTACTCPGGTWQPTATSGECSGIPVVAPETCDGTQIGDTCITDEGGCKEYYGEENAEWDEQTKTCSSKNDSCDGTIIEKQCIDSEEKCVGLGEGYKWDKKQCIKS